MNGIDRDVSDSEIFVEVTISRNITAPVLDAHFDLE